MEKCIIVPLTQLSLNYKKMHSGIFKKTFSFCFLSWIFNGCQVLKESLRSLCAQHLFVLLREALAGSYREKSDSLCSICFPHSFPVETSEATASLLRVLSCLLLTTSSVLD